MFYNLFIKHLRVPLYYVLAYYVCGGEFDCTNCPPAPQGPMGPQGPIGPATRWRTRPVSAHLVIMQIG